MAIEKVIDIKIESNADERVGSLRSQLREAQADVAALSEKFGVTLKEAIEAAKRAGQLKDQIGDAKALTDAFNPDAKFKALSSSLLELPEVLQRYKVRKRYLVVNQKR